MQAAARTEQALSNIAAARIARPVADGAAGSRARRRPSSIPASWSQIPDAVLAASNARARAAADNRR